MVLGFMFIVILFVLNNDYRLQENSPFTKFGYKTFLICIIVVKKERIYDRLRSTKRQDKRLLKNCVHCNGHEIMYFLYKLNLIYGNPHNLQKACNLDQKAISRGCTEYTRMSSICSPQTVKSKYTVLGFPRFCGTSYIVIHFHNDFKP